MGNCLVTKLKGTVDNDNLMILGSLKASGTIGSGEFDSWRQVYVVYAPGVDGTVKIISPNGCTLVDNQQGANPKTEITGHTISQRIGYAPNGTFILQISNKYDIQALYLGCDVDLSQLKYTPTLTVLHAESGSLDGIDSLDYTNFIDIVFVPTNNNVEFDLAKLSANTVMQRLQITYMPVKGDIANLANKPFTTLSFGQNPESTFFGDIAVFAGMSSISQIQLNNVGKTNLSGDLSVLNNINYFSYQNWTPVFRWQGTKTGKRISLNNITLAGSDLDAMLTNQASLEAYTDGTSWKNIINIRTSPVTAPTVASSVFNAIKAKGITMINIDGVEY